MGVGTSLTTAISGLEANAEALGVVSDNVVNANTTAFKASRSEFETLLTEAGGGTSIGGVTTIFTQGPITKTDRPTDLAINGSGFFCMRSKNNSLTYTRDGSFSFDKDGWLSNVSGSRVQAFGATDGKLNGKLGDLRIPTDSIPAKATTKVELHVNLDSRTEIPEEEIDSEKPEDHSQFTTKTQVFDSLGKPHEVTVYFRRNDETAWEWHAMADGTSFTEGVPGVAQELAYGTLRFDGEGKLESSEHGEVESTFVTQNVSFDFGDAIESGGTGLRGSSQTATKFLTVKNVSDGWAPGNYIDSAIDTEGVITGVYSNGLNRVLGQLVMARFEAPERLERMGENQYKETAKSGIALVGKASTNGRGSFAVKSLEQSNVDLAKEFVDMIKYQRGFQAAAKSITTANEMIDQAIHMKGS